MTFISLSSSFLFSISLRSFPSLLSFRYMHSTFSLSSFCTFFRLVPSNTCVLSPQKNISNFPALSFSILPFPYFFHSFYLSLPFSFSISLRSFPSLLLFRYIHSTCSIVSLSLSSFCTFFPLLPSNACVLSPQKNLSNSNLSALSFSILSFLFHISFIHPISLPSSFRISLLSFPSPVSFRFIHSTCARLSFSPHRSFLSFHPVPVFSLL
jgi:hypothetical protein